MGSGEGTEWRELRAGLPLGRRTFLLASGGVAAAAAGCADEDGGGDVDPIDDDDLGEYTGDDESETTVDDGTEPDGSTDEGAETPDGETADDSDRETDTTEEGTETPDEGEDSEDEGSDTPEEGTGTEEGSDDSADDETETPEEAETPEEETETTEGEDEEGGDDRDESEDDEEEGDEETQGIDQDHPAASGIGGSPVLGPDPSSAPAVIVAFDDPSCPNCADFHRGAFQDLRADTDAGELSFVWRGLHVTEDWSEPALHALWATYDRDRSAFWGLKSHLFSQQGSLSEGSILDEVESYLEGTGVDAAAVRSEAESGAYGDRIGGDYDAARAAGVPGTPVFFLFRGGEFLTTVEGPQNYAVFANALGL
ncbi:DsbA family protein [Natronorarus salvus]|uniref:DsbA family protein n=1 Tax=Natronorarus salvus TaxID=3117733 RepID=UPI002F260883